MIYAIMFCVLATGNCTLYGGQMSPFFNTFEACERDAQLLNRSNPPEYRAVCFEKPGWQPARRQ